MRVIAGRLGGRTFDSPSGHKTHPMSEKMRGAIFNILGDISGLTLLDAYSGSGAIALEAISRGAVGVVAIDSDKKASEVISTNSKNLDASLKVTRANITSWIDNNPDKYFDIVVCDPPYDDVSITRVQKVSQCTKLGGMVVISLPPDVEVNLGEGFNLRTKKEYGDSTLVFYRRIG